MAQEQHRTTARILDIFEQVSISEEGLTLTALAQRLSAPKSSLFPIVHTMEERRYLIQDYGTGRYQIGPGALILGASFSARKGMEPVFDVMRQVVAVCQETCQFGILDRGEVFYVAKEDSPQAIRMISRVGTRLPANATALGKALLSGHTDQEVRGLYPEGLPKLSQRTITDMDELLDQLRAIREGAVATEWEESTDQLACWAVPLRKDGRVFAALSVSIPVFRCGEEKIAQVAQCLCTAQSQIEKLAEVHDICWSLLHGFWRMEGRRSGVSVCKT